MKKKEIPVEELGEIEVYDENDEAVDLSSLWEKTTAVLIFVRQFG